MNIIKTNVFESVNNREIYNALYATLIDLKPNLCLEIGTFHGKSAEVFQKYFDEYNPNGKLITIDIKKYVDLSWLKNVIQLIIYPHVENSETLHYVTKQDILPYDIDSVNKNIAIVESITKNKFDFCFLDGDHQMESVKRDFDIANRLLKEPKYILFDDIDDDRHDSMFYYRNNILNNDKIEKYDFKDWNCWVGAVLLKNI